MTLRREIGRALLVGFGVVGMFLWLAAAAACVIFSGGDPVRIVAGILMVGALYSAGAFFLFRGTRW